MNTFTSENIALRSRSNASFVRSSDGSSHFSFKSEIYDEYTSDRSESLDESFSLSPRASSEASDSIEGVILYALNSSKREERELTIARQYFLTDPRYMDYKTYDGGGNLVFNEEQFILDNWDVFRKGQVQRYACGL